MYFLVAIYEPLVIFSFISILTQGVKQKTKNISLLTCNVSKCMLLQNVIVLLSSKFYLGIGESSPTDKNIFQLKQQVAYKSLGYSSENEKQSHQIEG